LSAEEMKENLNKNKNKNKPQKGASAEEIKKKEK
jgi:hypothetical protein